MINRRGFLGVCGAVVGVAVLPTKSEPVAVAKKASCCDYKLTTSRYVRPGSYGGRVVSVNPINISAADLSSMHINGVDATPWVK